MAAAPPYAYAQQPSWPTGAAGGPTGAAACPGAGGFTFGVPPQPPNADPAYPASGVAASYAGAAAPLQQPPAAEPPPMATRKCKLITTWTFAIAAIATLIALGILFGIWPLFVAAGACFLLALAVTAYITYQDKRAAVVVS